MSTENDTQVNPEESTTNKKKRKRKGPLLNAFPQPQIPDELSVMSVYELVCYALIFFAFAFLFIKWNKVPVREFDVNAERIDSNQDFSTISSQLDVDWRVPMSAIYESKDGYCDVTCTAVEKKPDNSMTAANRLQQGNRLYGRDSLYSYMAEKMEKSNDNWSNATAYHIAATCSARDFFVMRANRYSVPGKNNVSVADFDRKGLLVNNLKAELFFAGKRGKLKHEMSSILNNTPYSRPKWYSLFDISQSYFKCHVSTGTIDDIRLTMNFEGAADIYDVKEKADSIYGSGAIYHLTNNDKLDTEIVIYARFKDLESIQSIRLFAVTAVLGGLITIFLAFIIILVYRILRKEE